jgi:hypothetical protein
MTELTAISLVIQWVGILVIGGLLLFVTQSIRPSAAPKGGRHYERGAAASGS